MFQQLRGTAMGYRSRRQNRRSQYETKSHWAIAFVNLMGTVQKIQLRTIRPSELQTIERVWNHTYQGVNRVLSLELYASCTRAARSRVVRRRRNRKKHPRKA